MIGTRRDLKGLFEDLTQSGEVVAGRMLGHGKNTELKFLGGTVSNLMESNVKGTPVTRPRSLRR